MRPARLAPAGAAPAADASRHVRGLERPPRQRADDPVRVRGRSSSWKAFTAASVISPKSPSIFASSGKRPCSRRSFCSRFTCQPFGADLQQRRIVLQRLDVRGRSASTPSLARIEREVALDREARAGIPVRAALEGLADRVVRRDPPLAGLEVGGVEPGDRDLVLRAQLGDERSPSARASRSSTRRSSRGRSASRGRRARSGSRRCWPRELPSRRPGRARTGRSSRRRRSSAADTLAPGLRNHWAQFSAVSPFSSISIVWMTIRSICRPPVRLMWGLSTNGYATVVLLGRAAADCALSIA